MTDKLKYMGRMIGSNSGFFNESDVEIERLLSMTDDEVIAEAKALGLDINFEVKKMESRFELMVADMEFNKVFGK